MAQKSLLKTILSYIPALLGERTVAVLSIIVFTRMFSPEEYGRYSLALSLVLLVDSFLVQWLRLSYLRFHAIALKEGTLARLNTTTFTFVALIISVASIVSYGLLQFYDSDQQLRTVFLAAICFFSAAVPLKIIVTNARASEKAMAYGFMDVGRALFGFVIALLLITYLNVDERAMLFGPALSCLLIAVPGALYLKMPFSRSFSKELASGMFTYGIPLIGVFFLVQVMSVTDRICLNFFIGSSAVGLYAVGYNLANNSMMMIYNAINLGVFPHLVSTFENSSLEQVKKAFTEKAEIILAITLPAAVGLWVSAANISHVMAGGEFAGEAAKVIPLIGFAAFFSGLKLFLFDQVFHLYRKSKNLFFTMIPPVLANIVLNITLIPVMGLYGAMIATLISSLIGVAFSAFFSRSLLVIDINYIKVAKVIVASFVMGAVLQLYTFPLTINGLIGVILAGGFVYMFACFALNVLNVRTILMNRLIKE